MGDTAQSEWRPMPYQCMLQDDSFCICLVLQQHQTSRTERRQFGCQSLQDLLEDCLILSSGDEYCPVRAKTLHSDFQILFDSIPSRGRNQPSRPVSFGTLSTPHPLLFGHNRLQRLQLCQGRWCKHRCFGNQLRTAQRSFCILKNNEFWSFLTANIIISKIFLSLLPRTGLYRKTGLYTREWKHGV